MAKAVELHQSVGLFDFHVDMIIQQRLFGYDVRRPHRAGIGGQPLLWHSDLPRMRQAGYVGACLGIHYFPWESERGWRELRTQIAYLDQVAEADDGCLRVRCASDWERARAEGLLGLSAGVEGAHMLNGELKRVEELAALGVSYLTLTHFSKNSVSTPSLGRGHNERDGLTGLGRELIAELNRVGVSVDLSHVNTPGVLEACSLSKAPAICSHTGVKGVYASARNISDEEIDAIAELDGTVAIMFAPNFLAGRLRASSEVVVDHLEYVIDRVGVRHASLGSDYDGWLPTIPSDHRDCRDAVRVTAELVERGLSDSDIAAVLWDNATRVLTECERP